MSAADQAMTVANDTTIKEMIEGASRRLVVVTPGLSLDVAESLARKWRDLGPQTVTVALDVDPEVCRLGFGAIAAVTLLERTAAELKTTLNIHPGLRIGVIIADDETLLFAPTPLNIEADPKCDQSKPLKPNAIRVGSPPAGLARDLGVGPEGRKGQIIGLDKAERSRIQEVEADLKARPPQPFDISRLLRVFTAHLEFVELRLIGCTLDRRTIQIPSELVGLADEKARELLESKFRLVDEGDAGVWGEELRKIKEFIVKRFLVCLPTFGYVVRASDKAKFELAVRTLRKMLNRSRDRKCEALQAAVDRRLTSLKDALLPAVTKSPPKEWVWALRKSTPAELLDKQLRALTGSAREMLDEARVEVRFKGVTYDTLNDKAFIETVRKAMPDLTQLHEEIDAAPSMRS